MDLLYYFYDGKIKVLINMVYMIAIDNSTKGGLDTYWYHLIVLKIRTVIEVQMIATKPEISRGGK
ncbi:hypothetical protein PDY_28100 [Photobacterium damselae subsp. damselae]|nr:hypothetical protein PDY_28100 [Photobacterium damselae subsp. damselae]